MCLSSLKFPSSFDQYVRHQRLFSPTGRLAVLLDSVRISCFVSNKVQTIVHQCLQTLRGPHGNACPRRSEEFNRVLKLDMLRKEFGYSCVFCLEFPHLPWHKVNTDHQTEPRYNTPCQFSCPQTCSSYYDCVRCSVLLRGRP